MINISETWLQMPDHFVEITKYSLVRNDRGITLPDGSVRQGGEVYVLI